MVGRALSTMEQAGLVYLAQIDPELEYIFRHALIQDAAYQSLLRTDRRRLHQQVGQTIEQLFAGRLDEHAAVLGYHFLEADDVAHALRYLAQAGDHAFASYANAEALAHYAAAAPLAREHGTPAQLLHVWLRYGRALELAARYSDAAEIYAELAELGRQRGDMLMECEAEIAGAVLYGTGTPIRDTSASAELGQQALKLAQALGDRRNEARALWALMLRYSLDSVWREAIAYGERGIAIAREEQLPEVLAYLLNDIQYSYQTADRADQALEVLKEAQGLWVQLGNRTMLADNLAGQGILHIRENRFDAAVPLLDEALAICQQLNDVYGQARSHSMISQMLAMSGQFSLTMTRLDQLLEIANQHNLVNWRIEASRLYAQLYAMLGHGEQCRRIQDELDAFSLTQPNAASLTHFNDLWRARASLTLGDAAGAAAELERVDPEQLLPFSRIIYEYVRAWLLVHTDPVAAIELVRATRDEMTPPVRRDLDELMLYVQALAELALGRLDDAWRSILGAIASSELQQIRWRSWRLYGLASTIAAQRGMQAQALHYQRRAQEVIAYVADHAPPHLRARFLNREAVRKITAGPSPNG